MSTVELRRYKNIKKTDSEEHFLNKKIIIKQF